MRRGESDESLRSIHISQLLERAILEKQGELGVTPEEVDAEYEKAKSSFNLDVERIRIAQIVFEHGEGVTEEQAMAEAQKVYEEAKADGSEFGALAEKHSDVVTRQLGATSGFNGSTVRTRRSPRSPRR